MTPEEVAAFLEQGRLLHVATIGPDVVPHLTALWYVMEEGRVAFRSFSKSQKIVNLERDDRITVLVDDGSSYATLRGVMIRGRARLVRDREAVLRVYRRVAKKYQGVHLGAAAAEAAYGRYAGKNTVVVVEPEQTVSWDHSKLGGAY